MKYGIYTCSFNCLKYFVKTKCNIIYVHVYVVTMKIGIIHYCFSLTLTFYRFYHLNQKLVLLLDNLTQTFVIL